MKKIVLSLLLAAMTAGATDVALAGDSFPFPAKSWGGILRAKPDQASTKLASLKEGQPLQILAESKEVWNEFPWFKVKTASGKVGYTWGGIICAIGKERPGFYQVCPGT